LHVFCFISIVYSKLKKPTLPWGRDGKLRVS